MSHLAHGGGLLVAVLMALTVITATRRLLTALLVNHRYRFATWRWGRVLAWMLALGALLKTGLAG